MGRHRIDVSVQAKMMLRSIAREWGTPGMSQSAVAELCIQAAYERVVAGGSVDMEMNPVLKRLDEIYTMLELVMPEV